MSVPEFRREKSVKIRGQREAAPTAAPPLAISLPRPQCWWDSSPYNKPSSKKSVDLRRKPASTLREIDKRENPRQYTRESPPQTCWPRSIDFLKAYPRRNNKAKSSADTKSACELLSPPRRESTAQSSGW